MKIFQSLSDGLEYASKICRKYSTVIFILVLAALSWIYDYPSLLFRRPQAVHSWRQCDGASLALSYYRNGMHFFEPSTHGMNSDKGTTGFAAPSELPVLYYFVALLYTIFGYHEFLFRLTNLLIFYLGLFYLFKLSRLVINDVFYAIAVVVLIFASPLIVYYANNYLPNTVALSFTFIGWYFFYLYFLDPITRRFLKAMIFFAISGSMKITELAGPIIILLLMMGDRFQIFNLKLNSRRNFTIKMGALCIVFAIAGAWIIFAKYYNNLHGSVMFSTFIFPFWNLDANHIRLIFHKMYSIWLGDYYWPPILYLLIACLVLMQFFLNYASKMLNLSSLFYLIGLVLFSLLWFEALGVHDYFFTGFYILPAFIFINLFMVLKFLKPGLSLVARILIFALLIPNVIHARDRQNFRYNSWMNDYSDFQDLYSVNPYLKHLHIQQDDKIVYFSSLNIRPLYLMNLNGWTLRDPIEMTPKAALSDSILMIHYIGQGARYLIANNINALARHHSLLPYTRTLVGRYQGIFIFKLPPEKKNFVLSDSLQIILNVKCDLEQSDSVGRYAYYNDFIHLAYINGAFISDFAYSGKNSMMLNAQNQYGLTTVIKAGAFDRVTISAYQYPNDNKCFLVVSSRGGKSFNISQQKIKKYEKSGWSQMECQADIPGWYNSDSLAVYFWNSGNNNIYVDDFEIKIERHGDIMPLSP